MSLTASTTVRSQSAATHWAGRPFFITAATNQRRCGSDFGLCYAPDVVREEVALADYRNPVRMLIGGSLHGTVYRYLHKKRRDIKKQRLQLWEPIRRD